MLIEHFKASRLAKNIAMVRSNALLWCGVVFRAAEPIYANTRDLLTGVGSRLHGGRWNPPGKFAAVYASLTVATAIEEAMSHFRYYHLDANNALPRTIVAIDVRLKLVLDLTDGSIRQFLKVAERRMVGDDWRKTNQSGSESLTQTMGRAAYVTGLEGILVRACDGGTNLIWFPGNLAATSSTAIRNAGKL